MVNICVVGTGYVGLVTGTCLAEKGNRVCCVDVNEESIGKLRQGVIPIYEPGLDELVARNAAEGRLFFSTEIADGMEDADLCFIAVGTPSGEGGETELKYVYSAADDVAASMRRDCFVVMKSTVPVGTGRSVRERIRSGLEERGAAGLRFEMISNPEFLKEGSAIDDFFRPDRVVVGVGSEAARTVMEDLYYPFVEKEKVIFMDIPSAEITKYASNAMLATRISFMNEIALLCDIAGADVLSVREGIATDRRIGKYFLNAGCGYGGSCFPKDIQALDRTGRALGLEMKMAAATSAVNERQKRILGDLVVGRFGKNMKGRRFAVLGLAFKPNTDDMRYAPSIPLIHTLSTLGATVVAYDPIVQESRELPGGVVYAATLADALEGGDAAILVTEWEEFRNVDWVDAGSAMRGKVLFDGRNIYDPTVLRNAGFEYYCIGRSCTVRECG